jgi:hypothetical protein
MYIYCNPDSSKGEDKTADELIRDDRCAVPRELFKDVAALFNASNKTHCEIHQNTL